MFLSQKMSIEADNSADIPTVLVVVFTDRLCWLSRESDNDYSQKIFITKVWVRKKSPDIFPKRLGIFLSIFLHTYYALQSTL